MIVWFLTLAGLILRFWHIGQGLPKIFYSDEGRYVYLALNMGGGDLNPHHFFHPNLYYYLCFFGDVLYILGGLAAGIFKVPSDAWELYQRDPTVFYIIGRSVSALLGTLTIPLTYLIGKKVFDQKVGIVSAFFLTFSFLHVQFSQIGNMDVPLTFFITLTFLFAWLALETGKLRYFILCGLVGGLAGSTKHQGFETLLWGPVACFFLSLKERKNFISELFGKRCFLFFLFFVIGFTLGTPYWLLDFQKFKSDVLFHWFHYKTHGEGQLGYEGDWNWFYYLSTPLAYGLGLPLEIAGILGLLFLLARPNPRNIFFVSFPLAYFLIAGFSKIRTSRYMIPLVPFFCLAAAALLIAVIARLIPERNKQRFILVLAALVLIFPSLLSSFRYAHLRTTADTRYLAAEWIDKEISPKDSVLYTNYSFLRNFKGSLQLAPLDAMIFDTQFNNRSSLKTAEAYRKEGFDYVVLDEWHKAMVLQGGARDPRYKETVQRYQDFLKELEGEGKLVATFSPYNGQSAAPDLENVEIPSRSLRKTKNTGPAIWVYKL